MEGLAGYARRNSMWTVTFGLACCAIEMMSAGGANYDLGRFGMEVFRPSPAGRPDDRGRSGEPEDGTDPSSGVRPDAQPEVGHLHGCLRLQRGMFNNYAIVQGVDHVVPVDIYLPGCPPRPEQLMDAILKLHTKVADIQIGADRDAQITAREHEALLAAPASEMKGLLR